VGGVEEFRAKLIRQLQGAYSGELAAGHAYAGHAHSVQRADEKARIAEIEEEEWVHRKNVAKMLAALGSAPDPRREKKLLRIGRTIAILCHIGGWYVPMYGAGRLESHNVKEYEDAAEYALGSGHEELAPCLLRMAEVEWDHEAYFRSKVESHWLRHVIPVWPALPPKESIRRRYAALSEPREVQRSVRVETAPDAA